MKTDSLFYELFKLHPKSLFELAGLEAEGEYVFESITVKTTEKRMDGFFRRTDGSGADIFLEVQGYDDSAIYWRLFREISTHYEQSESGQAFPKWKNEIDSLKLSENMNNILIDLLENAILSRFPKLTLEEIKKMIRLTPLDKTVAGQELIQMGINEGVLRGLEKGRAEGRTEGELIGKIHATQRFLNRPITPKKKLLSQSTKELRAILKQLEAKLN